MKKKAPEILNWSDLKIGDFIESRDSYLFCYAVNSPFSGPSCLGRGKPKVNNPKVEYTNNWLIFGEYKKFKPTKSFIKICKKLLKYNLEKGNVDNLSYIEALAALKKYD